MNENIENIKTMFRSNDKTNAANEFKKLKARWEKSEKIIQFFTEHNELDIVNEQLSILCAHFENNEFDEFFEALYELEFFINHIYEKKMLNTETVF